MPMAVEEILYSAMEDFYIDIMIGTGEANRSGSFGRPPFTLIGATTRVLVHRSPVGLVFITGHMPEYYELMI